MEQISKNIFTNTKSLLNNRLAWQLALATALGAYGGFPEAPEWWENLKTHKLFQLFTLWLLVFSGSWPRTNTLGDIIFTTIITLLVYGIMCFIDLLYKASTELKNLKCEVVDN